MCHPPNMASGTELTVTSDLAGQTLAALVRALLPGTSWRRAQELCTTGRVFVDGGAALDPAFRPPAGSRVEARPEGRRRERQPVTPDDVVHLDPDVVVVRKPAGVMTVPFEEGDRDTLVARTRVALKRLESARGRAPRPTLKVVQRLDKDTTGLLVFARHVEAERHLQQQLRRHTVARRYLAIAHGTVETGTHDSLLLPDRGDGLRGSWGAFRPPRGEPPATARRAVTHVEVLERLAGASLAACTLETGRQHQIRIHLAEAGHPLVGEKVYVRDYGGPLIPAPRPMLHATLLGFEHPRTGEWVEFEDPPPADFQAVLKRLRR